MNRNEKSELIKNLNSTFTSAAVVVVTKQVGMTVSESNDLRSKMRLAGGKYQVTKNRLTKLALKGTKFECISELFSGPTAIAISSDPVTAPKVIIGFTKENEKISVIGGGLEGELLNDAQIKNLASLPSLDELRSKIIGLLTSPAQKIASVLKTPATKVAQVLNLKSK